MEYWQRPPDSVPRSGYPHPLCLAPANPPGIRQIVQVVVSNHTSLCLQRSDPSRRRMSRSKSDGVEKGSSLFLIAPPAPIPSLVDEFRDVQCLQQGDRGLDYERLPSCNSSLLSTRVHLLLLLLLWSAFTASRFVMLICCTFIIPLQKGSSA
jgi:hypothetical protein